MDRVNGNDYVDIGGGRRGFRSQNAGAGVSGTEVTAAWLNGLQEEIAKVIEEEGLDLNAADDTLLWQALGRMVSGRSGKQNPWLPIKSMTVAAPPVAPEQGDNYLIPAGATGDWAGKSGQIAEFTEQGWHYFIPRDGHGVGLPDGGLFQRVAGVYMQKIAQDVQTGKWVYATAQGTANARTLALTPALASYEAGLVVTFRSGAFNSGPMTLNINGLGAKPLRSSGGIDLLPSQMRPGVFQAAYSHANDAFELLSPLDLEASLPEAIAGTLGFKIITPQRLASATQRGAWNYATTGGTANVLTAALTPALEALTAGLVVNLRLGNTNTGAATLNLNGLGAKPLRSLSNSALAAGDLVAGSIAQAAYDVVTDAFVLLNLPKGVGPYALGNIRTLTASGTYTPPPGCRAVLIEGNGGGGAGGGAPQPAAGNVGVGGGGGAGGYFQKFIKNVAPSYAISIGDGGAARVGLPGLNGGTTSFGPEAAATGGLGGGSGIIGTGPTSIAGGAGGAGSSGDVNANGSGGSRGASGTATGNGYGGDGASSFLGGGGLASGTASAPGQSAVSPGAGGGGGVNNGPSIPSTAGGAGASGIIVVWEYF